MGKFLAIVLLGSALIAGVGMYYLQVYHFYEEVVANGESDVELTTLEGEVTPIAYEAFQGIDANSSPIRYRACFMTRLDHEAFNAGYEAYEDAVPLEAPGWFDCFDAQTIGEALENGEARAFLGQRDVTYGIDRVVTVFEDGQGFVWHQINPCGEVVFDGEPVPDGCPAPPE